MTITVTGGEMSAKEKSLYVEHIEKENPGRKIDWLKIQIDGEYVDLRYQLVPVKFDRIRRITGYLVGSMDRWNDAKLAEERDRAKHGL